MSPFVVSNLLPVLNSKKILLGISGSIAAFKACDLVRFLRECGAQVRVVLTDSAQKFVTPLTLETLSGQAVHTSLWETSSQGTHHIDSARWADLILIAPATANMLAKLAQGLADDLLSTECLAFRGPLLIAPAMNPAMFSHAAVQMNLETLRVRGVRILGPDLGVTACGEEGLGRMVEPETLIECIAQTFYAPKNGKHALITLGPTRSFLDPIRYLTNRSSGKMGASLCWAAVSRGYRVTAIQGPCDAPLPGDAQVFPVLTAEEMAEKAMGAWREADVFISAAAVLDWDVSQPASEKLKKEKGTPRLEFTLNPDILARVSQTKSQDGRKRFVLGFAAETSQLIPQAIQKRLSKGCDAVFVNDVSSPAQGLESPVNGGYYVSDAIYELPVCAKPLLARALLSLTEGAIPPLAKQISGVASGKAFRTPSSRDSSSENEASSPEEILN